MHIKLKNIKKSFITNKKKGERVEVLKDISCTFEGHRIYFLTGPSGSGKSTLLSIIGNLDKPTEGEILFDGKKVEDRQSFIRDNISFVFQEYNLFENMTVYENLSLYQKDKKIIKELLEQFNCSFSLNTKVKYLSGGERQRLSILRSYIKGGEIFLMDEPTGNLDENNSRQVMELITSIAKDKLIIVVSHNLELANEYGDIIYSLKDGKLDKMEKTSTTLTIDLKNDTNKAFNPIIEKLLILGSINLTIEGKEEVWSKDDYLDKIENVKNTYHDKIIKIEINTRNDETKLFSYTKTKNKVGGFLTKYSFKNIYSRLGRTIFSFIALILCFTLIFIMFNYIAYDPAYYIMNNLTTYGIHTSEVYLNKQQPYYDGIALHDVVDDDNNYYPFIDTTTLVYNGSYLNFTIDFLVTKSETITYLDETYVVPEDELLVFDYVKEYIDTLSLANQLSVRDLDGTIHDINISSTTIATDVVGVQEHGYAFLSFDYFMSLSNNNVPIVARAPQKIGSDTTSLDLQTFYRYDNQNLVEGDSIQKDDEIIVSTNFVDKFISDNVNYNDVIGQKFIIPAYSTYSDEMKYDENCRYFDLHKLFGEVTIVGVSDDTNADIYLSPTSFGALYEQRISRYHVFITTPNMHDKINYLYSNDVWLNNEYATPIYSFAKIFKQNLSIVFIVVTILTFIIATFILLNWTITIIKDRYREIAIMKCLGLSDKKIYPTFSSMILIISSFCTIIALVAGAALTPLLNLSYTNMLSISANSLVYTFNIYSFLVPILFFFIVPPLLTLIFVKQINKLEPYDALKEFR